MGVCVFVMVSGAEEGAVALGLRLTPTLPQSCWAKDRTSAGRKKRWSWLVDWYFFLGGLDGRLVLG